MRNGLAPAFALILALAGPAVRPAHAAPDAFAPIDHLLPAPDAAHTVTGRAGPGYWQQQADFDISVAIDPETMSYQGLMTLTYSNNSPDALDVLWLELPQNRFEDPAIARYLERLDRITRRTSIDTAAGLPVKLIRRWQDHEDREFGFRDLTVSLPDGTPLAFTLEGTHMRVVLPGPLGPEQTLSLDIGFAAHLVDADAMDARSGFERLDDGTPVIGLAHWFPRPLAYTSDRGWHHEPFLEQGEFTTEFGDYMVRITVPETYVVAATGMIANPDEVLSATERGRLAAAKRKTDAPTAIVTQEEAARRRAALAKGTRTWVFEADRVRDFAIATSPAFLWDAMAVPLAGRDTPALAQALYPAEGLPVWQRFGVEAVAHTLEVYSGFTFAYPYPQATAINGVINSGMEYPMMSFNAPRPHPEDAADGIYTARDKYSVIGIIVHETGHGFFPMIVNSDERVWMWMDEGMNTFLEMIANSRWERNFDESARRRTGIIAYMASKTDQPVMSTADSLIARGPNAYTKPATALMVLRELVLGREAFDRAFAAYAREWAFKRPVPADFFRMMEQESGQDLDWFWRAWFYGTDHVDIAVEGVIAYTFTARDAEAEADAAREAEAEATLWRLFEVRDREEGITYRAARRKGVADIYTQKDRHTPLAADIAPEGAEAEDLRAIDRAAYDRALAEGLVLNVVDLRNAGGVPTPVPLVLTFEDGSSERLTLPVHIWRLRPETSRQIFARDKAVVRVELDPDNMMVDAEPDNNLWPPQAPRETIFLRDTARKPSGSLMRDAREADQTPD